MKRTDMRTFVGSGNCGKRETRKSALAGLAPIMLGMLCILGSSAQAQSISSGQTLWTSKGCNGCHGTSPDTGRRNAADASSSSSGGSSIISRAIANNAATGMGGISTTDTERRSLAMYIESILNVDPISTSRSYNTGAKTFLTSRVIMSTSATGLNVLETGTSPGKGAVTYSTSDPSFTYTPSVNQCGSDSFTFRARNTSNGNATGYRTVNISIADPVDPNISTSSGTLSKTVFSSASSWTPVNTGGTPQSYSISSSLPSGLSFSTSTGAITGTPASGTAGTYSRTITAFNCGNGSATGQSGTRSITITINKASQSISWSTPSGVTYSPGLSFALSPTATASSGLSVAYTSATTSVCTISGTTVSILSAGTCTLNANQAGNSDYNAATQVQRSFTVSKAAQSITFGTQTTPRTFSPGATFDISPTATASSGLAVTYNSGNTAVCTLSSTTLTMVSAGTCPIEANQAGNTNYNAAIEVIRNVVINPTVPAAPSIVSASVGDGSSQVSFNAPANTGGTAITGYTATCVPSGGGSNRTATGASSPLTVASMTNSTQYSCSVTATNSVGTGAASASLNVTPMDTPVAPAFTSGNATSFTVLNSGNFAVTATGVPAPTFTVFSGTLPSGVTLSTGGALSGTPATGTAGSYPVTLRATNSAGTANQSFTLTVSKRTQSISFTPTDQVFSGSAIPLSATATSGLTVSFSSATPGVCTVAGSSVTMVTVGICDIIASQAGNADYLAATNVQKSFNITQGTQTINFPAQTSPRAYPVGGTFLISPVATATSGLAISYSSNSTGVCTVEGTTVTVIALGDCLIEAEQAGNANYAAADPVSRTIVIQQASQSITFAATQPAQNFVPSGTFNLNPLGSASSGLPVTYTSTTEDVCTIESTVVTIANVGICTIAANQSGNEFYAAATQVTRAITINPVVPGAPTIGVATPANGAAAIEFLPPSEDGGSAVTSYTVTCNPDGVTGSGASSPVVVGGLTNGQQYACSVAAVNSAGTGPASATVNVTPFAATGAQLWATVCTACHTPTPEGIQLNGAGTTATVLAHVRANQESMVGTPAVQALSNADLALIAAYINDQVPNIVVTTPPNTAKTISVSSHVTLTGSIAFNAVEVVTAPTNGSLGSWFAGGRSITYTPANGFSGTDSFTYRPKHTTSGLLGDARTVTINVTSSTATLTISPAGLGEGTVNSNPFGVVNCYMAGGEIQSGTCNNVLFPLNTAITLTATAFEGSEFDGWSGVSCSGGNSGPTCTFTLSANSTVAATFSVAGSGPLDVAFPDFNADDKPDLIWTNTVSGATYIWRMNGVSLLSDSLLATIDPVWKIQAVADFNGDGHPDVIYRNTSNGNTYVWYLVNGVFQSDAFVFSLPPEWVIQGVADFNADGKPDFLMRNTVSGNAFVWYFNNNVAIGDQFLFNIDPGWKVEGVADLNGDNQPDLLFRNVVSGLAFAWMSQYTSNTLSLTTSTPPIFSIDYAWEVVQVADWNGDGKPDLVFRNSQTGVVFVWYLDGTTLTTSDFIIQIDPSWEIVPRR
jgi:mono/diheme cytochrome c family protein